MIIATVLSLIVVFSNTSCGNNEEASASANEDIDSLLELYPDSIPLLLKKGQNLTDEYLYDDAMSFVTKAFRLDTNKIASRHLYAELLNNRMKRTVRDVQDAQRHYLVVIKAEPKNTKALVGLASTYSQQRDYDKSFKYINDALRIDKRYRDAYVLKGTNYRDLGEVDLMKSSYETAIQQDPEFFAGYFELGRIYQMEQDKICIEYFTTALTLKPNDPEVRYQLAYSKQHFGQVESAMSIYREMAADTVDFYVCHALFQLGHIKQFYEDDYDSAKYYYGRAIKKDTTFVEAWHNLGVCYDLTGDKEHALRSFGKALKHSNQEFTLSRQYADSIR